MYYIHPVNISPSPVTNTLFHVRFSIKLHVLQFLDCCLLHIINLYTADVVSINSHLADKSIT